MLPNLPQVPVVAVAVLRAGLVLVNISPQCPPVELEFLRKDSAARAVIAIDVGLPVLRQVWGRLLVKRALITPPGDLMGAVRGRWVNHRWQRQRAPDPVAVEARGLPGAVGFRQALAVGRKAGFHAVAVANDDIALRQYSAGTNGRPGAHRARCCCTASCWPTWRGAKPGSNPPCAAGRPTWPW